MSAYIPIKIGQDVALLPLVRAYRYLRWQAERLRDAFASHELALIVMPVSAETRLRLRRYHEARADANRALAVNPNNAAAWHSLGNALSSLKRHKAAIACYDKALALVPENNAIWKDRGAAIRANKRKTANSDLNEEPSPIRRMPMGGPCAEVSFWRRSDLPRPRRQAIAHWR